MKKELLNRETIEVLEKFKSNEFIMENNLSIVDYDGDNLVLKLEPKKSHFNILGMLHGATIYAIADTAAGFLCILNGKKSVTLSSSFDFISNIGINEGAIFSKTKFIKFSGRISIVDVEIYSEREKLLAKGVFRFYKV